MEQEKKKRSDSFDVARLRADLAAREKWNDETLRAMLRLVVAEEEEAAVRVLLVDSLVLNLLVDAPKKRPDTGTRDALRAQFKEATQDRALVLLPLHHDDHWSLLVYAPAWHHWFVADSLQTYHEQRVLDVMARLDALRVVAKRDAQVTFFDRLPEQLSDYECARYVVYYAFLAVHHYAAVGGGGGGAAGEYGRALGADLTDVTPARLPAFERQLDAVLLSRVNKQ